jgi:large subunit ribosomal protein L21
MYAIVKTGGKQYRVERGQRLLVERLKAEEGADVDLEPILYRSQEAVFDKAGLEGVTVTAKVLGHVRGEKLRVFKFKPKRGYKRRTGHRQELTQIEVTEIAANGRKQAAKTTAKPVSAKPAEAEATPPAAAAAKPEATPSAAVADKPKAGAADKPKAGAATAKPKAGARTKPKAGAAKAKAGAAKAKTSKEKAGDGS